MTKRLRLSGHRFRRPLAIALLAACSAIQCSPEDANNDSIVARTRDGWVLTLDQVQQDFARVNPKLPFEDAPQDLRASFLTDEVNGEIMRGVAMSELAAPSWESERRVLVAREEWLAGSLFRELLGNVVPSDDDKLAMLGRLDRAARLQRIVPPNKQQAERCYQALQNGLSFDEAYEQYSVQSDDPIGGFDLGAVTPLKVPRQVARAVFLGDLAPNHVTAPIATSKGFWIVKFLGFEKSDLSPAHRSRLVVMVQALCAEDSVEVRRDALSRSAGYHVFEENFPVLSNRFDAFWDSLSAEQPKANEKVLMSWKAPTWLLAPEERELRIYAFYGDTGTAVDFVESLNSVNSLSWPSGPNLDQRKGEIRRRIRHLFLREEAVRRGYDKRPELAELLARQREEGYLDDYFDQVVVPAIQVTPEEAVAEYEAAPERYRTQDRVAFAYLIFPRDRRNQASAFLEEHRADPLRQWFQAAARLAAQDSLVLFSRDTGLIDLSSPPRDVMLEPLIEIAAKMETGELGDLVELEDGVAILRCNYRKDGRALPREAALPLAEGEVRAHKTDAFLEAIIKRASKERGLEVFPERLVTVKAAAAS